MRFVIVTGMSGAGKSTTLKMMEDMGYFCVDNMPIPLMTKLTELLIVPNVRSRKSLWGLISAVARICVHWTRFWTNLKKPRYHWRFFSLNRMTIHW